MTVPAGRECAGEYGQTHISGCRDENDLKALQSSWPASLVQPTCCAATSSFDVMSLTAEQVALFQVAVTARFPVVLKNALQQAQKADINTTERILLDHGGIAAGVAYLVLKDETDKDSHMRGKINRKNLVRYLNELPIEARRSSATQLRENMKPHEARVVRWARQPPRIRTSRSRRQRSRTPSSEKAEEGNTGLRHPHENHNTPTASLPSTTPCSDEPIHQGSGHAISHPQHIEIAQSSQRDILEVARSGRFTANYFNRHQQRRTYICQCFYHRLQPTLPRLPCRSDSAEPQGGLQIGRGCIHHISTR